MVQQSAVLDKVAPAQDRLTVREKLGFGFGDAACNMSWGPVTMFLTWFYTDIFGLNAALIATMFLVVRLLDAFIDPVIGALADRYPTRHGRFRPWILYGCVPFCAICIFAFYTPDLTGSAKEIYAFVTYLLLSVLYSTVNIPYCSLGSVITANPVDRVACQSYRFTMANSAVLLCSLTLLPLVDYLGGGNQQKGFFITNAMFSVIGLCLFLLCFFNTRERIMPQREKQENIVRNFRSAFKNDQWLMVVAGMFIGCIPAFVCGGATIYFTKYLMHLDNTMTTLFISIGVVACVLGNLATSFVTRYICKVKLYISVGFITAGISVVIYFVDPQNVMLIFILNTLRAWIGAITVPVFWSFIADADDYGEWKLKKRMSGIYASGNLFALKVSLAIGGAVTALVLSATHYVPEAAVQTPATQQAIMMLITFIPAIGGVLTSTIFLFYKLDKKTMQKIQDDLSVGKYASDSALR
ncbi:glycoside-pentoside-hexuronide (GPH):cation symporter [Cronobacter dublinensis]